MLGSREIGMRSRWQRIGRLIGQDQALANARAASTELSRLRVERDEVDLFLRERLAARPVPTRVSRPA